MSKPRSTRRDVSGWLVLNKPWDMTSTEAVGKVRWLFGARKAGHAGTLDPLATGILPIALGEATKTVPQVQDGEKRYRFTLRWGEATSTDDAEGEVVATSEVRPERAQVLAALPGFTGEIMQRPPAYSAIRIGGERAYDLARAGERVDLQPRPVVIEDIKLVAHDSEQSEFDVICQKGTYVRALARDLAERLGTCAHVIRLHRAAVGPFTDADALGIADIEACPDRDTLLKPVAAGLAGIPEIRVSAADAAAIRHGNPVMLPGAGAPVRLETCWASHKGAAIAIGTVAAGQFHPGRVLLPH